ncbi:hypothetical protein LSPCS325_09080 [Lysinibacillus sp. CTST325]
MSEELKTGWVLQLKEEYQESGCRYQYYCDEADDQLTDDLTQADLYIDKEQCIKEMKAHEQFIKAKFGEDAICNVGYTNMMKHFEFVEVEYSDS